MRKYFNCLCPLIVEELYKLQMYAYVSSEKISMYKVTLTINVEQCVSCKCRYSIMIQSYIHKMTDRRALRDDPGISLMISQHRFRSWLGAIRQQAITWVNVDPDLWHHIGVTRPQWVNMSCHRTFHCGGTFIIQTSNHQKWHHRAWSTLSAPSHHKNQ